MDAYRLLIGSVGDDSHSVGMRLLEIAFREAGFVVKNIGILNVLDDFFYQAGHYDAIFISCMNGHADLYLTEFPYKLSMFGIAHSAPKVWYLGGNLSVREEDEAVIRRYRALGFDYVAPKPASWDTIIKNLMRDFNNKGIKKKRISRLQRAESVWSFSLDTVNDDGMSDEEFALSRESILASWPTGSQVWTADVRSNHADPHKNLHNLITERLSDYSSGPLVQPRTGVAHTSDEIVILKYLRENGLQISSIQLDAASRKKMFGKAEEGVLRTEEGKASFLNGYPVPVHGVKGIERILSAIDTPFQIRAGSPDHRFVYEIGLAGGASSVEGGFICYLYPYDKNTSPVLSLRYWKYIDKLTEWYLRKYGVVINREYFGSLTCCLIEPSIPICINIIQAILSAKSGVKCISVGLAEQGNRAQDIAAIRALDELTRRFLGNYGFHDCTVSTVYHQYMAAFPTSIPKSEGLIRNSSTTAALAGATRIMTKTPVESVHIPSKEDNARGLALTIEGIRAAKDTNVDWESVQFEKQLIEREVLELMRQIEMLGQGSLARGAIRAFRDGILDIPFSPSAFNQNQLITLKDCNGAVRFSNPERLCLSEPLVEFHKTKVQERMTAERASRIYELLEKDLTRVWKNDFALWPLDGHYVH
ncbi:MAG: Methylaspartate mutase E chain [Syntrophorhabdus sp. PtaB.Bin006]|nr:MAG: Methylaspartate mutase E chain [Syntrophorhabdus sp. PtaB.Bin006]